MIGDWGWHRDAAAVETKTYSVNSEQEPRTSGVKPNCIGGATLAIGLDSGRMFNFISVFLTRAEKVNQ